MQPILQDITGFIGRYSSHLDTLGNPTGGPTLKAIDADTRVAGVTLVAWGRIGARYDAPIRVTNSRLGTPDAEYFALYPNLKLLKLGGVDVPGLSVTCNPQVGTGASYSVRCFSDYNSFIMENAVTEGMGACPSIPPKPTLPREATMRLEYPAEMKMLLKKMLGREDDPPFENVELR